jgi:hypothetical protein
MGLRLTVGRLSGGDSDDGLRLNRQVGAVLQLEVLKKIQAEITALRVSLTSVMVAKNPPTTELQMNSIARLKVPGLSCSFPS